MTELSWANKTRGLIKERKIFKKLVLQLKMNRKVVVKLSNMLDTLLHDFLSLHQLS